MFQPRIILEAVKPFSFNCRRIVHNLQCLAWPAMITAALLIGLLQCGCAGERTTALTFYVDATHGDDDDDGTTKESAWKTLDRVNSCSLLPGDVILLKRGEVWRERLTVPAADDLEAPGCIKIGAYGEGSNPVIGTITIRRDETVIEDLTVDLEKHRRLLFQVDERHQRTFVHKRIIDTRLLEEFTRHGINLSPHAITRDDGEITGWVVRDYDNELKYSLRQNGDSLDIYEMDDAVRLFDANECVLRNLTLRNGTSDGIDANYADRLLVEGCHIHHFLAGAFTHQEDAHGIVITHSQDVTIRNCDIHHVSGDCFQSDPYRSSPISSGFLIEDCHFWTTPLTEDFNAGWKAGDRPGENGIDTKVASDWRNGERMQITLRNIVAHGWKQDSFINSRAAFNLKEKIEAILDGVTVYDCENAFRLRGTRGNANVTLINSVIHNCEFGIRAEDNLQNLAILNCTFGTSINGIFKDAGMARQSNAKQTWTFRNNAFTRPLSDKGDGIRLRSGSDGELKVTDRNVFLLDTTNQIAAPEDFVDIQAHDYRLNQDSRLIDQGDDVNVPVNDFVETRRTLGSSRDIGAFEFGEPASMAGDEPK